MITTSRDSCKKFDWTPKAVSDWLLGYRTPYLAHWVKCGGQIREGLGSVTSDDMSRPLISSLIIVFKEGRLCNPDQVKHSVTHSRRCVLYIRQQGLMLTLE